MANYGDFQVDLFGDYLDRRTDTAGRKGPLIMKGVAAPAGFKFFKKFANLVRLVWHTRLGSDPSSG
jgi:hypothetical protein